MFFLVFPGFRIPEGSSADRLREMEEQDFVEGEEDLLDLPYENELEDD